ncbi:MAG: alpha-N-arabinofuranosidase, partial [Opitutales bacterium]|jgi:alpha-N-arabinofuranosidase
METTGLVLEMYRDNFGSIPVVIGQDFAPLDLVAALTADGRNITVGVVNPTAGQLTVELRLTSCTLEGAATRFTVSASDAEARNEPGKARVVDIVRTPGIDASAPLVIPAFSASIFIVPVR